MRNKKNETETLEKGGNDVQLDCVYYSKAVLLLRAVNHKLRQRVIDLFEDGKTMTATDIYFKFRLEQSVASPYLVISKRAGFVIMERQSELICHLLDKTRLTQISLFQMDSS